MSDGKFIDPAMPDAVVIKCPICWRLTGFTRDLACHLIENPPKQGDTAKLACFCNVKAGDVYKRLRASIK